MIIRDCPIIKPTVFSLHSLQTRMSIIGIYTSFLGGMRQDSSDEIPLLGGARGGFNRTKTSAFSTNTPLTPLKRGI